MQAMDQGVVEGDIDGASDGRSNGWYMRWITKQSKEIWMKERWMVQAMEGAMDGTSYGSGSSRTNVLAMDQGAVEGDIDGVQAMEGAMDGTSD